GPTRRKALVCEWEDGTMEVHYRGEKIAFTELREPIQKPPAPLPPAIRAVVARKAKPDHPWRQGYRNMKPRVPVPALAARWPAPFRFALTAGLRSRAQANENMNIKKGTLLTS